MTCITKTQTINTLDIILSLTFLRSNKSIANKIPTDPPINDQIVKTASTYPISNANTKTY